MIYNISEAYLRIFIGIMRLMGNFSANVDDIVLFDNIINFNK